MFASPVGDDLSIGAREFERFVAPLGATSFPSVWAVGERPHLTEPPTLDGGRFCTLVVPLGLVTRRLSLCHVFLEQQ